MGILFTSRYFFCVVFCEEFYFSLVDAVPSQPFAIAGGLFQQVEKFDKTRWIDNFDAVLYAFYGTNIECYVDLLQAQQATDVEKFMKNVIHTCFVYLGLSYIETYILQSMLVCSTFKIKILKCHIPSLFSFLYKHPVSFFINCFVPLELPDYCGSLFNRVLIYNYLSTFGYSLSGLRVSQHYGKCK